MLAVAIKDLQCDEPENPGPEVRPLGVAVETSEGGGHGILKQVLDLRWIAENAPAIDFELTL
jgi:hypothetical protein